MVTILTVEVYNTMFDEFDNDFTSQDSHLAFIGFSPVGDELLVSSFEIGMSQDSDSWELRWFRSVKDMMSDTVRRLYGSNKEVTTWVDGLGGLRRLQEELCGFSLKKGKFYDQVRSYLTEELGYDVPAMGEPMGGQSEDTATSYSDYAMNIHRMMRNRRAYGELTEPEHEPDYRFIDVNERHERPFWWSKISIGKIQIGVTKRMDQAPKAMVQVQTSKHKWVPDLRFSTIVRGEDLSLPSVEEVMGSRYQKVSSLAPWCVMQDNPTVREFMDRFYNFPKRLAWRKVKDRWCCGMLVPGKDAILWAPVSHKSSASIDWWKDNEGKPYTRKNLRAVYVGAMVFTYRKVGDKIAVQGLRSNNQTGQFEVWMDELMAPNDWGKFKAGLIRKGGKDAYLGYPERLYKPTVQEQDVKILRGYSAL